MHCLSGFWMLLLLLPVIFWGPRGKSKRRIKSRNALAGPGEPSKSNLREADIYRIARRMGGTLTVSDLIAESGVTASTAEALLERLVDGVRVQMEVTDDGVVLYEFHEFFRR